ncbi:right-handed parallel beta-helix repeat-containing protein [Arcticibacter sp. MXS-1]|uniref:right-handed parallel beta-helix repeat-containing protein n=1 Tax=Arcticibacter sp. MXS-1 TaxID=3341726 RepID=UPI0035A84D59
MLHTLNVFSSRGFVYLLILLAASFVSFIKVNQPATYYVDAIHGNDAHAGTSPSSAWRTLDKVNTVHFSPGDKLLFKAGTSYQGQLRPKGSGVEGRPVVIDRYGQGAKPTIAAEGLFDAALYLHNQEYYEINNLILSNKGPGRKAKRYGVHVEIHDFGTAHHLVLRGVDVKDVNGSLVKKEGGGAAIVFTNGGLKTASRFDGIIIEGCRISNTARNGVLINGNWMRSAWLPNLNVVIRDNMIEGVPGDGIVPTGCDGALIERNIMRDCPRLLPGGEAAAGIWPWSCDNTIVQYNEVSDHKAPWDGQGFDSDWNCRNTLIQYNYSHDNEGGFLLICNDGGAAPSASCGNTGTVVRYNLSVNDGYRTTGKHSGFSPVFHITGPTSGSKIYNNVIYISNREPEMDSTLIETGNWNGEPVNTLFANNIFYVKGVIDYNLTLGRGTFFENNLYFGTQLNRPPDDGAVTQDPLFIRQFKGISKGGLKEAEYFRIKSASPAAYAGKAIAGREIKDFFGTLISINQKPCIGIHQR